MRARAAVILAAALAALAYALSGGGGGEGMRATVLRAVDGDTLEVAIDGRERSVRLLGIDTPETHRPGTPVECGGREASASMEALAPAGTPVALERDPAQDRVDRYGRLLAYVRLPDGRLIEDLQLRAGWAATYVYARRPVARYGEFRRLEALARAAGRGVWGACGGQFHRAGP
jgi:micrococcal nuclease